MYISIYIWSVLRYMYVMYIYIYVKVVICIPIFMHIQRCAAKVCLRSPRAFWLPGGSADAEHADLGPR